MKMEMMVAVALMCGAVMAQQGLIAVKTATARR